MMRIPASHTLLQDHGRKAIPALPATSSRIRDLRSTVHGMILHTTQQEEEVAPFNSRSLALRYMSSTSSQKVEPYL